MTWRPERNDVARLGLALLIIGLVVARAIWPGRVAIDSLSIVMITVALVLVLSPYLRSAKLPGGTELRFRSRVTAAEKIGAEVEANKYKENFDFKGHPWPDLFDISDELRTQVYDEPGNALAGLRHSIIHGLRSAARGLSQGNHATPHAPEEVMTYVIESGRVRPDQAALMRIIWDLCNGVPLQGDVTVEDALRVFAVTDVLNDSFVLGYSLNFDANPEWEEAGLICQFEHCIEHMPTPGLTRAEETEWRARIQKALDEGFYDADPARKNHFTRILSEPMQEDLPEEVSFEGSCPIFGHFCPGGPRVVESCPSAQDWVRDVGEDADDDEDERDSVEAK